MLQVKESTFQIQFPEIILQLQTSNQAATSFSELLDEGSLENRLITGVAINVGFGNERYSLFTWFSWKNRSSILSQIFITSEFEKDCSTSEFEKDSCKTTKSDFYIYCKWFIITLLSFPLEKLEKQLIPTNVLSISWGKCIDLIRLKW